MAPVGFELAGAGAPCLPGAADDYDDAKNGKHRRADHRVGPVAGETSGQSEDLQQDRDEAHGVLPGLLGEQ